MDIDAKQRNKILLLLFVGVLMGALDIAIVGPAFPAIQAEFAVGSRQMAWIFNIYVLVSLISTPLMAKLSDRFGRRSIYILDVALFVSGSLVVASARSIRRTSARPRHPERDPRRRSQVHLADVQAEDQRTGRHHRDRRIARSGRQPDCADR